MALTEIPIELSSTPSIVDGGNATAITIDSSENVTFAGAITAGASTFTTADNLDTLSLISTDADANQGPILNLYRNSASPADNDLIGSIKYVTRNDNAQDVVAFKVDNYITDVSDGTEDAAAFFYLMEGGALRERQGFTSTETAFNEDSVDVNFRVESNGATHMLFVDGGDDVVLFDNASFSAVDNGTSAGIALRRAGRVAMATANGGNAIEFAAVGQSGKAGSISVSGTSTTYGTSSDYRLKENVAYTWDATTRLKQLKPARFNFIADVDTTVDGFLAHEVQAIVPEAITGTKDAVDADGNPYHQGIDQSKLVPLLVKTIQELEARLTALENN